MDSQWQPVLAGLEVIPTPFPTDKETKETKAPHTDSSNKPNRYSPCSRHANSRSNLFSWSTIPWKTTRVSQWMQLKIFKIQWTLGWLLSNRKQLLLMQIKVLLLQPWVDKHITRITWIRLLLLKHRWKKKPLHWSSFMTVSQTYLPNARLSCAK